jgi:hypothetical protein
MEANNTSESDEDGWTRLLLLEAAVYQDRSFTNNLLEHKLAKAYKNSNF